LYNIVAVTFTDGINLITDHLYIFPLFSLWDIVSTNGLKIVGQCDVKHIMTLPIMPGVKVSAYIITSMTNHPVRLAVIVCFDIHKCCYPTCKHMNH